MKIINFLFVLLLLPAVLVGQTIQRDTFDFDYLIRTDGGDRLTAGRSTIVLDSSFVFAALPKEQFLRTVTGRRISEEGETILTFANGDGLRLTTFAGSVTGCFLVSRKRSFYLGQDKSLADQEGWTNQTILKP